jgi:hypothetical protein
MPVTYSRTTKIKSPMNVGLERADLQSRRSPWSRFSAVGSATGPAIGSPASCAPGRRTRSYLDALSEAQVERLHAGLVKLASMDEPVLAALVEQVLSDDELASSS